MGNIFIFYHQQQGYITATLFLHLSINQVGYQLVVIHIGYVLHTCLLYLEIKTEKLTNDKNKMNRKVEPIRTHE